MESAQRTAWEWLRRWQRQAVDLDRPGTYTQAPVLSECESLARAVLDSLPERADSLPAETEGLVTKEELASAVAWANTIHETILEAVDDHAPGLGQSLPDFIRHRLNTTATQYEYAAYRQMLLRARELEGIEGQKIRAEAEADRLREEVEARQAAIDKAHSALSSSQYVGGPTEREAWRIVTEALYPYVTQHIGANPGAESRFGPDGKEREHE